MAQQGAQVPPVAILVAHHIAVRDAEITRLRAENNLLRNFVLFLMTVLGHIQANGGNPANGSAITANAGGNPANAGVNPANAGGNPGNACGNPANAGANQANGKVSIFGRFRGSTAVYSRETMAQQDTSKVFKRLQCKLYVCTYGAITTHRVWQVFFRLDDVKGLKKAQPEAATDQQGDAVSLQVDIFIQAIS
uniref:Uncharacterized protein n=1 Tax=Branchiostoma floridae TaxID=7739 RepID=C3YB54_BRAFL|eukprot:XP_002606506.1 hypothetical protein BRAFLDRAFT_91911 [Branchiostoma floridae]